MSGKTIGHSVSVSEWQRANAVSHPALSGMALTAVSRVQADLWRKAGWLDVVELRDGLGIEAFAFAGTLHIATADGKGLTIDIRPKIAPGTTATLVRYALGLNVEARHATSSVPLQSHGLVDILAHVLLDEIDDVLHRGILHDYRSHEAYLSSPRGRIRFDTLASQPQPARFAVPCRYATRSADVPLNRLALAALHHIAPQVSNARLRVALLSRAASLELFCATNPLSAVLLQEAEYSLDRRSHHYEGTVRLARLLLQATAPAFDEGQRDALPGFVIDMNRLFERFIARLCLEWTPVELRVDAQETLNESYHIPSNPFGWQPPRLCPDIVVRQNGAPFLVIDTKYKDLEGKRPAAGDLYQMTLYSMAFGQGQCVTARLVYPTTGVIAERPGLEFTGFSQADVLARVETAALSLEHCAHALQRNDIPALREMTGKLLNMSDVPSLNPASSP